MTDQSSGFCAPHGPMVEAVLDWGRGAAFKQGDRRRDGVL